MSSINDSYLIDQLNEYIIDLTEIDKNLIQKQSYLPNMQLLKHKINMKITHFKSYIHELQQKRHTQTTLQQLSNYFTETFSQTVKQAHRLLQVKSGHQGQQKLKQKLCLIRQMQQEMGNQWQKKNEHKNASFLKKINNSVSMLSDKMNNSQLKAMAKECLHKQFLAIRIIAYKLYQQYVGHSHLSFKQKLQQIQKQNQQLLIQAEQLSDINRELKSEEKRMINELNEIKRINDLVSKRYFITGSEEGELQKQG